VPTLRIRDDLGRDLVFPHPPQRIVSLVPSDTHSLFALGAGDRVVGRTQYCVEPAAAAAIPVIGGTKDVDVDAVAALAPHLVIANQEENTRAALEALAQRMPVLVSLPRRAADGIAHLARLGRILGIAREPVVVELIRRGYELMSTPPPAAPVDVFAPIWMDPLMTINGDTFGSDLLTCAGARNVFGDRLRLYPLAADLGKSAPVDAGGRDVRYPRIRPDEVTARAPRVVLLPDEPHAFSADDAAAIAAMAPGAAVEHVSGKDLFWYGAWTIDGLARIRAVIDRYR
jgi:ABC-type Fe3+-hydroxamate transport system substrate-binding protein